MTRFLSEALNASEPSFRLGLQHLESINGHPNHDIRLSTAVAQATGQKLSELGLDPRDTTPEELFHVLMERVKADDARLTRALRTRAAIHVSAEAEVVSGMVHASQEVAKDSSCFAIKATSFRSIIRKLPPKRAMKQLGYRSLDSFLKHESPASALAAAWLSENSTWQQQLLDRYKKLKPSDFESRPLTILKPTSKRWQQLASEVVAAKKHNLLSFNELGAIVLLPLPADLAPGVVTVSLMFALHELNEIQACGTYLKLCQVRPDFGTLVQKVAVAEPRLSAKVLDRPVAWRLIQHYYARLRDNFREEIFGPHIRSEDMSWQSVEHLLAQIEPQLAFWRGSTHLGLLKNRHLVSMNLLDVALTLCNRLPFEKRLVEACQQSLWHELMLKYLNHDTVEQTVLAQLQPQLAAQTAEAVEA